MSRKDTSVDNEFLADVVKGLSAENKYLQSKYFYDEKGDKLFQEIMGLPEYYLTDAENNILQSQSAEIVNALNIKGQPYFIVELGAGDAMKTRKLLKVAHDINPEVSYVPIDISANILNVLRKNVSEISQIPVHTIHATFLEGMDEALRYAGPAPCLFLFLGSNIGNLRYEDAVAFLKTIREKSRPGDYLLLGLDLKKDPETILKAYNDSSGITSEFNLNLLDRINRELGGNFRREKFRHYPIYDPMSGETRSYLISLEDQEVTISAANRKFQVEKFETIFMEVSRKFAERDIKNLLDHSGWELLAHFKDEKEQFADVLCR